MAKDRVIKRDEADEAKVIPTADAAKGAEAKEDTAVVAKPMNITTVLSGHIEIMSIRVVGDFMLYNNGLSMHREPIVPGKPITITMRQ